jgi:NAD(P)H-dependent FMN reductase
MTKIIGLSGSLRQASFNSALLRTVGELMPDGAALEIFSIRGIPPYDADVEARGGPEDVRKLKDLIAGADGLLLASPEYNNSVPGTLKNVIDWLGSPPADGERVFKDRPVAVMGVTTSPFGTVLAQDAWLAVFHALEASYWSGARLRLAQAKKLFDDTGKLTDNAVRDEVKGFAAGFVAFAARG